LECRRNKRNSTNALHFEFNAEENVLRLEKELKEKSYRPSRSILFAASKPKLREIFAADFRDRVVHHVLIDSLNEIWEPVFIHDSYACRQNKGTHAAVDRLQTFLRKVTSNGNLRAHYLQLDIKDFFMSINKQILFELIKRRVADSEILWLAGATIFADCTKSYYKRGDVNLLDHIPENKSLFGKNNERGLPIGNLTSQFFANVYLNELDQFVKHTLKANYYIRYVDDFVILSRDINELEEFRLKISKFIESKLLLQLHPKRQKLRAVSDGIDFLGYIVRQDYILVRRRVVNNLKRKIKEFRRQRVRSYKQLRNTMASYMGHFKHANVYHLIKKFSKYMRN